jgi:uncharacterized protein (TIGR04255 family)
MVGRKMTNAPVYYTIAQVRYNPVLSLENYVAGIQESLRKAGYPDFKRSTALTFNITALASSDAPQEQPKSLRVEQFTFSNMKCTQGFILDQNALSFQSTEYDTFESFSGDFLKGLEIVHKAIGLDFSERVGLRYLDAVVPLHGEKELPKFLVSEVLGLTSKLPDDMPVSISFSESHIQTSVGNVLSRTIIQNSQLGFPPDIRPIGLKVADRFAKVSGVHAIIDTDGSYEKREQFDLSTLKKKLQALHDEIIKVFEATLTKHALDVWK